MPHLLAFKPESAIVMPTHEALRMLHRDELAAGPTPESIALAKEAQRRERMAVAALLLHDITEKQDSISATRRLLAQLEVA